VSDTPDHMKGACIMDASTRIEHVKRQAANDRGPPELEFAETRAQMDMRALAADLMHQRDEMKAELAAIRSAPFVPAAEHERVLQQRNDALKQLDETSRDLCEATLELDRQAGEILRLEQLSTVVVANRLRKSLAKLAKQLEDVGGFARQNHQDELWEARALLAEVK
jgi:DNA-directed RNA polymerase specialized sigma subunit